MSAPVHTLALNLEASQFLGGWRADAGTLFLPALSEARVGDEVAVRIGIYGQPIRATIFGKIGLVRRVGRPSLPPGVELALDKASVPAARFLATAASGESVTFRERAPRFAVERPLTVVRDGRPVKATTINISDGGCSVAWPEAPPPLGEVVAIRLAGGLFPATARAVVCWNTEAEPLERAAGLKVISAGRGGRSWRALVAAVARSGARTA